VRIIPKGMQLWQQNSDVLPVHEVQRMYAAGFMGVWEDPQEKERVRAEIVADGGVADGADAAHANGWAGSAAGLLVPTWVHVEKAFPGCWPGAAQERGDCVSHSEKNACLVTIACEIAAAKPDEVTGKVEGVPEIPAEGIRQGALSTEWPYWFRGYNGDGWHCGAAMSVTLKQGVMLRKPYTELGIDLTKYSGSLAGKYGSRAPGEDLAKVGREHLIRTGTEISRFEEVRDFLANGYGVSTCGGEGFSSTRDENGVSKRQGSWAHAMAAIGVDDRPETHRDYGGPLVLILNSWGKWNSGPRQVKGTNLTIPEGSFWAKWSDIKSRDMWARSSAAGWPRKQLPDYLTGVW